MQNEMEYLQKDLLLFLRSIMDAEEMEYLEIFAWYLVGCCMLNENACNRFSSALVYIDTIRMC